MAFVNPISQTMPGFGAPSYYGYGTITPTVAAKTVTIANTTTTPSTAGTPFNLSGGPPPSRGKIHIRAYAGTSSGTVALTSVTITDGTTTENVYSPIAAVSGNLDIVVDFNSDLAITSISVVVTFATDVTAATFEVEVSLV